MAALRGGFYSLASCRFGAESENDSKREQKKGDMAVVKKDR